MKTNYIKFSDIDIDIPSTWEGKKILSFDIDWASDEVLNHLVDILENADVKCCFFVTHETRILQRLRNNDNFELGIHPNFNQLLSNTSKKSPDEILHELKEIVPEAKVFRSHSLTTSGNFLGLYQKYGAVYLSNYMMNGVKNLKPFYHMNGLIEVPIYYADDGDLYLHSNSGIPRLESPFIGFGKGITVYNFHPIHIALNCRNYEDYQNSKQEPLNSERIKFYALNRVGIKNKLEQLLNKR
jgi:hypothetical protein